MRYMKGRMTGEASVGHTCTKYYLQMGIWDACFLMNPGVPFSNLELHI